MDQPLLGHNNNYNYILTNTSLMYTHTHTHLDTLLIIIDNPLIELSFYSGLYIAMKDALKLYMFYYMSYMYVKKSAAFSHIIQRNI